MTAGHKPDAQPRRSEVACPTCGGRGWHTAGGNDPAACGRCPAGEAWWSGAGLPKCEHKWEYLPREPGETYTGYCERCAKCGEIVQIVQ